MENKIPNLLIKTSAGNMAQLYFYSDDERSKFCRDISFSNPFKPIFIIYKGTMFTNGPVLTAAALVLYDFKELEALNNAEFMGFFRMILNLHKEYIHSISLSIPKKNFPEIGRFDLVKNPYAYHFENSKIEIPTGNELEEKIIDMLDPPGLENALNEAVRIENFEAAAYIRNRIEDLHHAIIEDQGRLKVRMLKKMIKTKE